MRAIPVVAIFVGRQSKIEKSENQHVGLAHGLLDVPDTERVGRQHQCIATLYVQGFAAVVRGERATAGNEMAELLRGDLPAPAPRRAFPDAGFDAVIALDAAGRAN